MDKIKIKVKNFAKSSSTVSQYTGKKMEETYNSFDELVEWITKDGRIVPKYVPKGFKPTIVQLSPTALISVEYDFATIVEGSSFVGMSREEGLHVIELYGKSPIPITNMTEGSLFGDEEDESSSSSDDARNEEHKSKENGLFENALFGTLTICLCILLCYHFGVMFLCAMPFIGLKAIFG